MTKEQFAQIEADARKLASLLDDATADLLKEGERPLAVAALGHAEAVGKAAGWASYERNLFDRAEEAAREEALT